MDKKKQGTQRASVQGLLKNGRQRRALQNPNDDFSLIRENTGLDVETIKLIKQNFQNHQSNGIVHQDKLYDIFLNAQLQLDETYKQKIIEEYHRMEDQKLDLINVCHLYQAVKERQMVEQEEANNAEYVDAFVAMGGNSDRTGTVQRNVIINVIKEIFQLTFDIEEFMRKQEVNSDELDFIDFCTLFDQNFSESKSIISGLSRKYREKNQDIEYQILNSNGQNVTINQNGSIEEMEESMYRTKPLQVNYKDFQKWMLKEDNSQFM